MPTDERLLWHASTWIIPVSIALTVAAILGWSSYAMTNAFIVVGVGLILALILLWTLAPPRVHATWKVIISLILIAVAGYATWWAFTYDRAILNPQIEGFQSIRTNAGEFAMDLQAYVRNTGRQMTYAEKWQLRLIVDGSPLEGKQVPGGSGVVRSNFEQDITSQDFPRYKPVRGAIFFVFPASSFETLLPYFNCNPSLAEKINIELSVWDSENHKQWTTIKNLKDFLKLCVPAPVQQPLIAANPKQRNEVLDLARQYDALNPGGAHSQADIDSGNAWINQRLKERNRTYGVVAPRYVPRACFINTV